MSIFANSMPSSWFSLQLINALIILLEDLTKSRSNPTSILELLKSHSSFNLRLKQNSIKVYSLLEKVSEYAKPEINSIVIHILVQYAQTDIFAIPFFETQLYVNFTFDQQVSLAIGKVLVSLGDPKSISSITQTLFQKQLDDFQVLFLTRIYYYYGGEKCKLYKFYSKFDGLFDDLELNEMAMFGLLGYIRSHQDFNNHNPKLVTKLFDGLEVCKPESRLFIVGEVVSGGKINLERYLSEKALRVFLLEGVQTVFKSDLYLSMSKKSLAEKIGSGYFTSLTRISNALSNGLATVLDDNIVNEVVEM